MSFYQVMSRCTLLVTLTAFSAPLFAYDAVTADELASEKQLAEGRLNQVMTQARKSPEAIRLLKLIDDQTYFMNEAIRRSEGRTRRRPASDRGPFGGGLFGSLYETTSRMGDEYAAASTARKYKAALKQSRAKLTDHLHQHAWASLDKSDQAMMVKHCPDFVREAGHGDRLAPGTVTRRPDSWIKHELPIKTFSVWLPAEPSVQDVQPGKVHFALSPKDSEVSYDLHLMQLGLKNVTEDQRKSLCDMGASAMASKLAGQVDKLETKHIGSSTESKAWVNYEKNGVAMVLITQIVFHEGNLASFTMKLPQSQIHSGPVDWFFDSVRVDGLF